MLEPVRWENLEHAARDAYEAYSDEVEWKNYLGTPMPQWDALPTPIKQAWAAAARRTLSKAYRIIAHHLIEHIRQDVEQNARALEQKGN